MVNERKTRTLRKLLVSLFICILIFLLSACDKSDNNTSPNDTHTLSPTSVSPTTPITTNATDPVSPTPSFSSLPYRTDCTLTLNQTPKLGEEAELTFTVNVLESDDNYQPYQGLARSKAWIDFYWTNTSGSFSEASSSLQVPAEKVLVSGELPWEGSYSKGLTLHGTVKLTHDGIWSIRGHFLGEGWKTGTSAEIRLAVADGTAAIMGTEDFKNGPLAYLGNLTYEGGVSPPIVPDIIYPVSLGLDISKAPQVGEEVTLTCRIISLIDMPDISIQWYFYKRTEKIPAEKLLTSADLGWKADIKKDEPMLFSTMIKFPTEGDWEIIAAAKSGTKYITGAGHRLRTSITPTGSYFGWTDMPVTQTTTNTPPGTTPTAHR
jgi:hypothetical protein